MPNVAVNRLPVGAKLGKDVHTSLGGLLFPKGSVLGEREIEFLKAFLITEVFIDGDVPDKQEKSGMKEKKHAAASGTGSAATLRQQEKKGTKKKKSTQVADPQIMKFQQAFGKAVQTYRNVFLRVRTGADVPVLEIRGIITPLLPFVAENPKVLFRLYHEQDAKNYVYEHPIAVGLISYAIAKWMKLPENDWTQVALAGTLLDIGMSKIDPQMLLKPEKLTINEFAEVKKHTLYGYQMVKDSIGLNSGILLAILQHHEREDGSGYPLGLKGEKLHLFSKIVAVADVYHAMCSDRSYRRANSPYLVAESLLQDSFGKLDPAIVHTFVNGITQFSIGTVVELSDGSTGNIIFTDRNNPTRPMVEVNGKIVNLAEMTHLSIRKVF